MRNFLHGLPLCGAISATLAAGAMLASCADENPWGSSSNQDTGTISLTVNADENVTTSKPKFRSAEDDQTLIDRCLTVPTPQQFSIKVAKNDGSYSKTWATLADFEAKNETFTTGTYTVTAFYGEKGKQGFEAPYFEASKELTVLSDQTRKVELNAPLQNAMVVIDYTEGFKNYMSAYHTEISTQGLTENIQYIQSENRAVFVEPREAQLTLHFTTREKRFTNSVSLGKFAPEAAHLYHITFDVEEPLTGTPTLSVIFDDNLEEEDFTIDLSDELLTTPAPFITCEGFTDGETLDMLGGTASQTVLKMTVTAEGLLQNAFLTIDGPRIPAWCPGGTIDLCEVSEETKAQMKASGIDAVGFTGTTDKLAFLDFTEFGKSLGSGEYTISLQAVDRNQSISQQASVTLNFEEIKLGFISAPAIAYGATEAQALIKYNGSDPMHEIQVETMNDAGQFAPATITACEEVDMNATRAFEEKHYLLTMNISKTLRANIPLRMLINNVPVVEDKNIPVVLPGYSLTAVDAYSRYAYLKFAADSGNADDLVAIIKNIRIFKTNGDGSELHILNRNSASGILTIDGLNPSTAGNTSTYTLKSTITNAEVWNEHDKSITTETELQVPNGDFETLAETINTTINQGGTWSITSGGKGYQTTLTMKIKEPTGWYSSNSTTCNLGSSNLNSWYVIPSVYNTSLSWVSNQPNCKVFGIGQGAYTSTADVYKNLSAASGTNAMVIRNVAWDSAGNDVGHTNQTGNTDYSNYYCNKIPNISNRSAGYMYLGTSSKEGADFTSRPVKLKGKYQYVLDSQDSGEKGVVTVTLLDGATVIGSGSVELGAISSYSDFSVPIEYNSNLTFGRKPTTLKIWITSSNRTSGIKTTNYCNKDECCSRGAALYIDNLTFEY